MNVRDIEDDIILKSIHSVGEPCSQTSVDCGALKACDQIDCVFLKSGFGFLSRLGRLRANSAKLTVWVCWEFYREVLLVVDQCF
jgi:hypothetical protein